MVTTNPASGAQSEQELEEAWEQLSNEAYNALRKAQYVDAEELFLSLLPVAEQFGTADARLGYCWMSLAVCAYRRNHYQQAIDRYDTARRIYEKACGKRSDKVGDCLLGLADSYLHEEAWGSAQEVYKQAATIFDEVHPLTAARAFAGQGVCSYRRRNFAAAIKHFTRALAIHQTLPNKNATDLEYIKFYTHRLKVEKNYRAHAEALEQKIISLYGEIFKHLPKPSTRTEEHLDTYHGVAVKDPYRWLEDRDTAEAKTWVQEQNKYTKAYLRSLPGREEVADLLRQHFWNERHSLPFRANQYYYFYRKREGQNQDILCRVKQFSDQPEEVFNPNELPDSDNVWVSGKRMSGSGKLLAYGLTRGGSDWTEWKVRDIEAKEDLPDLVKWIRYSTITWGPDSRGFFYSRFNEAEETEMLHSISSIHRVFYHVLGTDQENDFLVYERPGENCWLNTTLSTDGKYLLIGVWQQAHHNNLVLCKHLPTKNAPVKELFGKADASYHFICNNGKTFWFLTDLDAPKQRIIAVDMAKFEEGELIIDEVIPESEHPITSATIAGGRFIVVYLKDGESSVVEYAIAEGTGPDTAADGASAGSAKTTGAARDGSVANTTAHKSSAAAKSSIAAKASATSKNAATDKKSSSAGGTGKYAQAATNGSENRTLPPGITKTRELKLPFPGTAFGFFGRLESKETFFTLTSFTHPKTIYRYDLKMDKFEPVLQTEFTFDPDDFVTEKVHYKVVDGKQLPMFVVRHKRTALNKNTPVYLYGYGGFRRSVQPSFNYTTLVWMEIGGVYAAPVLRGGCEFGEDWHLEGTQEKKQNVFDDFIDAARWLIDNKFTSPARLAIGGDSNGGLTVAACITQRPELFAAAIPKSALTDMLRYHQFTLAWTWKPEYGSSDDAEQFKALYAYSPLHCVKTASFPAMLIAAADKDDRVVPFHSYKFAAALQAAQKRDEAPILIRVETNSGHRGDFRPSNLIVDQWCFLARALNMKPFWLSKK